jgi:hypothetical protein
MERDGGDGEAEQPDRQADAERAHAATLHRLSPVFVRDLSSQ